MSNKVEGKKLRSIEENENIYRICDEEQNYT